MKKVILGVTGLICLGIGTTVLAAQISGAGSVAQQLTSNLSNIARLITGIAYVAGMAFAVGAIVKFKAHKDQPTQVTIGQPIALLFIGAALIFIPTVFNVAGSTIFGGSGRVAGPSGTAYFGAKMISS